MTFNTTCPIPKGSENFAHGSAWKYMWWIGLGFAGVTTLIALFLIVQHLRRYRKPREQRHIIRIILSLLVYSNIAFWEIHDTAVAEYIDPLSNLYESFGLCALYLLFVQFAAPTGDFDEYTLTQAKSAEEGPNETAFDWVRISWVFVFQFPVVEIICVVIQDVTEITGNFCVSSLDPWFANLWVQILNSISIGACVTCIIKFRGHMKQRMKARRGLAKLICFKIIVGLRFFQAWIFSLLLQYKVTKPSKTFSYNDILWGIPGVLTCAEMSCCALLFWYAYTSTDYSSKAQPGISPMPAYKAVFHALSPMDLLMGIYRIPSIAKQLHQSGDWHRWNEFRKQKGAGGFIRKKFGGSNGGGPGQGRYQRMDDDQEPLAIALPPYDPYKAQSGSQQDVSYQAQTSFGGNSVYYPPGRMPPEEAAGFLSPNERPKGA